MPPSQPPAPATPPRIAQASHADLLKAPTDAPTVDRDPRWLSAAIPGPARDFARTALAFVRGPGTFAEQWRAGTLEAMNPLTFVVTAAATLTVAQRSMFNALGEKSNEASLIHSLLLAIAPYVYYAEIGLIAHLILRLGGSQRRWTSSVAMAFYAGATFHISATMLIYLIGTLATVALRPPMLPSQGIFAGLPPGLRAATALIGLVGNVGAFVAFGVAQARLHGAHAWRVVVAVLLAVLTSGAIAGVVRLPILQLVIRFERHGAFYSPTIDISD